MLTHYLIIGDGLTRVTFTMYFESISDISEKSMVKYIYTHTALAIHSCGQHYTLCDIYYARNIYPSNPM